MKRTLFTLTGALLAFWSSAQSLTATWPLTDVGNLQAVEIVGSETATALVAPGFELGNNLSNPASIAKSGADTGLEAVVYNPPFTGFTPSAQVSSKTSGHFISVSLDPTIGHKFKPTEISFDAIKCGTDKGGLDIYYKIGTGEDMSLGTASPARNKVLTAGDPAFSHFEYKLADLITDGEPFTVYIYVTNIGTNKQMAFRNISIKGVVDEEVKAVGDYVKAFSCTGAEQLNQPAVFDLTPLVAGLKNGQTAAYPNKLYGDPENFRLTVADGYTVVTNYSVAGHTLNVSIFDGEVEVMTFGVRFTVTYMVEKAPAKALKRGLMALSLTGAKAGTGNLVSWRHRESDGYETKYKLYRGDATSQDEPMNEGEFILDRTNYVDLTGTVENFYRLEVYNKEGNLQESEVSGKTWADQTFKIPTNHPADRGGASYSPNDASFCDMDGDGEYEIILKWSPSNEKDAASSGNTSPCYFDCYKLDGTQLWRIDVGPNFFTSAHTIQFIAWDFDGDGYGEFMMKTAPGTIDGEGNYVVLGNDDPLANLLSSNGKQIEGPEYITVFDGLTGGALATIPYHTDYAAGKSYWGDTDQNRSERYLAAIAWLDGPDKNPSPIFARGYYSGAFVCAYDWDGKNLTERWVSRNTKSGQGLWGEGAHWISVGDCDADRFQEIVYGSGALDHDGSLLYRTGLGHGDALHLGDFLPEREGMEVFMVHEKSPFGYDLRDAKTGKFLLHVTASSDTGRGLAAHFDSSSPHSQFLYSASTAIHDCLTGEAINETWAIGSSGAGINCRIYWTGDLYDEFFDKSIIAHLNPDTKAFDRIKINGGNYVIGNRNNGSKNNPCVMGDLLGDWREEIVQWDSADYALIINATSYPTDYRIPHLMDDLNYRAQVINQNVAYNQPPHLSFDPSVKYAGNPNHATASDVITIATDTDNNAADEPIYNLQGIRVYNPTTSGVYIQGGKKIIIK